MRAHDSFPLLLAGKSNLMDAVSFATGVQSKDLRGGKLKDLIYRATTDKGDGAHASARSRRCSAERPHA